MSRLGKQRVGVTELGVDYLTIVGHKFYGPRVGALYHKRTAPLVPLFYGGGQEKGLRPGTQNTPMIVGEKLREISIVVRSTINNLYIVFVLHFSSVNVKAIFKL